MLSGCSVDNFPVVVHKNSIYRMYFKENDTKTAEELENGVCNEGYGQLAKFSEQPDDLDVILKNMSPMHNESKRSLLLSNNTI